MERKNVHLKRGGLTDAAARDVIRGKYKNGAERKAALGDDYEMVQKRENEDYNRYDRFSSSQKTGGINKKKLAKRVTFLCF